MKKILFAIGISLVGVFSGCTSKTSYVVNVDEGVSITQTDTSVESISMKHYEKKEIVDSSKYNSNSIILDEKIINIASDSKSLEIIYDNGNIDNIDVQNSGFYIKKHLANSDHIVWIETNDKGDNTNVKRKEFICSRNLKTGEINIIEILDYSNPQFEIKQMEVDSMDISKSNILVYKMYHINSDNKVEEQLISYDLDRKKRKVIASNDSKQREFFNIVVSEDDVIYIENTLNNKNELMEQNLYFNNVKTANTNSIKTGYEVISMDFLGDFVGMISQRENEGITHTEFQVLDINKMQTTSRIFVGSKALEYIEKNSDLKYFLSSKIDVDSRYIYILGNVGLIYDTQTNKFISLESKNTFSSRVGKKTILTSNYKTGKMELYTMK